MINSWKVLTICYKSSVSDVRQGSESGILEVIIFTKIFAKENERKVNVWP